MKLSELKTGDIVEVDSGFTCMTAGPKIVFKGSKGLYVQCSKSKHYLDGQVDDNGELVGITKPSEGLANGV